MGQQRIGVRRVHCLKTWPQFFEDISSGIKTFEFRKDDHDFQVGDALLLQEYDPDNNGGAFTLRAVSRLVVYKLDAASFSGIEKGYCILGLGMLPQYAVIELPVNNLQHTQAENCVCKYCKDTGYLSALGESVQANEYSPGWKYCPYCNCHQYIVGRQLRAGA